MAVFEAITKLVVFEAVTILADCRGYEKMSFIATLKILQQLSFSVLDFVL
jgi:hypothetical protein